MYCEQIDGICKLASLKQTSAISMHIRRLVKIHWDLLKFSSRNENTDVSRADNSAISNQQSQIRSPQYQCTHEVLWKSTDIYWSYRPEIKILTYRWQITLANNDEICPLTIPNQISRISPHTPNLVKIHWHLQKLSSLNETTYGRRKTDVRTHGQPTWHHNTPSLLCGGL